VQLRLFLPVEQRLTTDVSSMKGHFPLSFALNPPIGT